MPTLTTGSSGRSRAGSWIRKAFLILALPGLALGLSPGCSKLANGSSTAGPTISSFSPGYADGNSGVLIHLYGSGFQTYAGSYGVQICGVTVDFGGNNVIVSDGEIDFDLPAVTTTGPVVVSWSGGSSTSGSTFIVTPAISSISPLSGAAGSTLTINGNGLLGVSGVTIGGSTAVIDTATALPGKLTVTVPPGLAAGSYAITLSNRYSLPSVTASSAFTVNSGAAGSPAITGFTQSGLVGAPVTLTGSGFTGATAVAIGALPMASFIVASDSEITCQLPSAAVTGTLSVTTPGGSVATGTEFIVTPFISQVTPGTGSASANTPVTITGTGLMGISAVTFGSAAASPTVHTANQIVVAVPTGAPAGAVTLLFTINPAYDLPPLLSPFTVTL